MTSTPMRSSTGRQASREERVEERRTQLAQSALATLGELGYAKTSLREIAQNSEFTHGVVHYYFADKVELITHCVRLYKTQCVNRFDEIVLTVDGPPRSCSSGSRPSWSTPMTPRRRCTGSGTTCARRACSRTPSETTCSRSTAPPGDDLARRRRATPSWAGVTPLLEPQAAYAMFDGLFEKALLGYLSGDAEAAARLAERVRWLLPQICPGATSAA